MTELLSILTDHLEAERDYARSAHQYAGECKVYAKQARYASTREMWEESTRLWQEDARECEGMARALHRRWLAEFAANPIPRFGVDWPAGEYQERIAHALRFIKLCRRREGKQRAKVKRGYDGHQANADYWAGARRRQERRLRALRRFVLDPKNR